jgi:hypothetical protein
LPQAIYKLASPSKLDDPQASGCDSSWARAGPQRLEERLATRHGEPRRPLWVIRMERICCGLSQEQGVPYEEAFREKIRGFEEQRSKQMDGYKGDGSPASVMRWLQLRRREDQLAHSPVV